MNTLPFNILSAIFAPLFVPWIELTLYKSRNNKNLNPTRIRASRLKTPDSDDFTPRRPQPFVLYKAQIIDDVLNPFLRGLPGACIGNIIWGLTFNLESFNSWWFCSYIVLLFVCLGVVNIVKTKSTTNPKGISICIIFLGLFFLILTIIRLCLFYL